MKAFSCLDYLPIFEEQLKVCDFCLRSELEVSPIRLTGDDDGLMVCINCEPKYRHMLSEKDGIENANSIK